jgi:hypothetical protein
LEFFDDPIQGEGVAIRIPGISSKPTVFTGIPTDIGQVDVVVFDIKNLVLKEGSLHSVCPEKEFPQGKIVEGQALFWTEIGVQDGSPPYERGQKKEDRGRGKRDQVG